MKNRENILQHLFTAYFDARRKKRGKYSQIEFEWQLEENILNLYEEVINKTYQPGLSICFVVNKPVKREIFAANFRDRVIHHFIFNILNPFVEKELLYDVYSCRKGKGTLFGIKRAQAKMQSCSNNYKDKAWVLKLDISGYFMAINKTILYNKVISVIEKNEMDMPVQAGLIKYLVQKNIFHEPTKNCKFQSHYIQWRGMPKSKSLFYASNNCGLPIGNLTSQLYGNLYLNDFDHYIKNELKATHYGRYVDDCYFICKDKDILTSLIPIISARLKITEGLLLHPNKIYLQPISNGFLFLGVFILPYRRYVGKRIKKGVYNTLNNLMFAQSSSHLLKRKEQLQSYIGLMKHHNTQRFSNSIRFLNEYLISKYSIL